METEPIVSPNSEVTRNIYFVRVSPEQPNEKIIVSCREFTPKGINNPEQPIRPDVAVVYISGWAMAIDKQAVTDIGTALADERRGLGVQTLAMTARAEHAIDNPLYHEAEAMLQEMLARGIKKTVLVGHSRGGDIATYLAHRMQELQKQDPEMEVIGLVLIDAMGTYPKNPVGLAVGFTGDSILNTPITVAGAYLKRAGTEITHPAQPKKTLAERIESGLKRMERAGRVKGFVRAGLDVAGGVAKEIISPIKFVKDIIDMAKQNPLLGEITSPVVLIQGGDWIAHPDKIVPIDRQKQIPPQIGETIETRHDRLEENMRTRISNARRAERYLKENLLLQSDSVTFITPENLGFHSGPLLRSDTTAHVIALIARRLNPDYFPKQPKLF